MATALTCTSVVRRSGRAYVRWSDKVEQEFDSVAQAKDWLRSVRDDGGDFKDVLRALLIAKWFEANPSGDNPALLEGRTITLDLSLAANIVRVT